MVLILVLVEIGLGAKQVKISATEVAASLNPCFSGNRFGSQRKLYVS